MMEAILLSRSGWLQAFLKLEDSPPSMRGLARRIDASPTLLSLMNSGERRLTRDTAAMLSDELDASKIGEIFAVGNAEFFRSQLEKVQDAVENGETEPAVAAEELGNLYGLSASVARIAMRDRDEGKVSAEAFLKLTDSLSDLATYAGRLRRGEISTEPEQGNLLEGEQQTTTT